MRVKAFALLSVSALALFIYLALQAWAVNQYKYENQLLVLPKASNNLQQVNRLEEINEEKFVLTYEIPQSQTVKALKSSYSATIIGTNYTYPDVTGHPMITGGFFTKSAQDAKNQYAVLNETAAFNMFGSMRCDGETILIGNDVWLVVGVINDKNTDDSNVYVPATTTGNQVQGLIAMADNNGKNEIYIQNALKDIGVSENGYTFSNLDFLSKMPRQRLIVALQAVLCEALLLMMLFCVRSVIKNMRDLKAQLQQNYLREIITSKPKHILGTAGAGTALLAAVASLLACLVRILDICLRWNDKAASFLDVHSESFAGGITYLQELLVRSGYAFIAALILSGLLFVAAVSSIKSMSASGE